METTLEIKVRCIDYRANYEWITIDNWTKAQLEEAIEDEDVIEIKITKK